MNIKLCYFQKNCIIFPTRFESRIESKLHLLGARWSHNQRGMRYYKDKQYKNKWGLYFVENGFITYSSWPDKAMYAYYSFPYTALTNFNSNKYPRFVCDKDNNLYNVLYLRRSKKYRLTNVDNLKKRFKVNKTELETKYYDV